MPLQEQDEERAHFLDGAAARMAASTLSSEEEKEIKEKEVEVADSKKMVVVEEEEDTITKSSDTKPHLVHEQRDRAREGERHMMSASSPSSSSLSTSDIPQAFQAEWPSTHARIAHARARRWLRYISWWYILSMLGITRFVLTLVVLIFAPIVMSAVMKNPAFWMGLMFSARVRRARALVYRTAAAIRYSCLLFMGRRVLHYVLAGLIVPGTWLLGEGGGGESMWMARSMKDLRTTMLQRCQEGRNWMTRELGGRCVGFQIIRT